MSKLDALRKPGLWKLVIGTAANLNYPGASRYVGPLLDRWYAGEDVRGLLFDALRKHSGLLPDEANEIIDAVKEARES